MSGEDEDAAEGFLARWSRRKRSGAAPLPEAAAELPASDPAPAPRGACPIPEVPEIDPASLPAIEELQAGSDFAAFLRPGVPPLLRQAALRRMWSLDASIRDYIGPVEYQWDFNAPGGLPAGFASELVGDVKKLLAQAIGQSDEQVGERAGEQPGPAEEAQAMAAAPEAAATPSLPDPEPAPLAAPEPAPVAQPPRRRHGGALPA